MLTYLIKTTESLIAAAIMLGLLIAYVKKSEDKADKITMFAGVVLGLLASIVMSVMKNATNKIDTGMWNLRIFGLALLAFLFFLVFSIRRVKKAARLFGWGCHRISAAILAFTIILYALPDVWAYPYGFLINDLTILSTEFLYKFIGYILGWLLIIVVGLAIYQGAWRMKDGLLGVLLKLALFVNAIRQVTVGLQIMLAKRIIMSNHFLFMVAKFSSNYSNVFTYGAMVLAAIIPIVLWAMSFRVDEPYANPAEHRKIIAKWRKTRKWASVALIALLFSVLNMTVVRAIDNREVELSPVEDAKIEDGNVYVSFDQVEDGHLHRFGYVTENGTQIRFIVIKKPNSSAYGIGLDACDICGETGYYEKDGQVVCKLCDVVMNINTIGFKGGCNPIVIDYSISNGQIIVPIDSLLEYESEFK